MSNTDTNSIIILNFPLAIIIAIILSFAFFIVDYINEAKTSELQMKYVSLIAGISLAYFFLVLLPEIAGNLPEYPLHLRMLEYAFILIGFVFIHVTEKIIFQKVDKKAQEKIRQLLKMESNLDTVEQSMGQLIRTELTSEDLDHYALQDLARVISELIEQEEILKTQDLELKSKIQTHINEDLDSIHVFMNFIYHFLVGLILIYLLLVELIIALFFFFFAFFKALISKTSNDIIIFPDAELNDEISKPSWFIILGSLATFFGIIFGIITQILLPLSLELLYVLFSFISGVILYIIVREVIPEKEKGEPYMFLLGVVIFFALVLLIRVLG
ncbi:MAG: hypothetical protein ACTSR8_18885 [Promethearchaeota archaeon]